MTRKNLTDCISQETLERLTEEAFETPKARALPLRRALALAACFALVVLAANFDTVYAAVQKLLYFIPGSGPVTGETPASYWLSPEEYKVQADGVSYFVSYIYRRDDVLSCRVEKEVPGLEAPEDEPEPEEWDGAGEPPPQRAVENLTVEFRDEAGQKINLPNAGHNSFAFYDGKTGAAFAEELTLEEFHWERFTMVLDGTVEIPVELRLADPAGYAMERSTADSDQGYTLSLLPLNQNGTRFAVVPQPEDRDRAPAGSYWSALSFDIHASGEAAEYHAEAVDNRPGCQEFYMKGLPDARVDRITVEGILESTRYEKSPASVKLPPLKPGEEVPLSQRIELQNITLLARAAGLDEDGRLWVELDWEAGEGRRLNQVDVEWPESESYGGSIVRDGSYVLYHEAMGDRAGKKTTLPITFVSLVQKGEWSFTLER